MVKEKSSKEEFQKAKEDLEDLEMYIEEFSAFLPLAVSTINPIDTIININRAFENLTGYTDIEIIGRSLIDIFLEKRKMEVLLNDVRKKEKLRIKELTIVSKEKRKIPVSVSISMRKDREGNFIGYFLALFDITEIKKFRESLEEKVRERTRELRNKVEELEKFHELAVGRELKMVELKKEIERLKKK